MISSALRGAALARGLVRAPLGPRLRISTAAANGGTLRKTFEPDYLDVSANDTRIVRSLDMFRSILFQAYASDIPLASGGRLNVQMCGYDFPLLESYQSFVHNLCENMGIDVGEW